MPSEFKPNIYPVMYWALAYGLVAGFLLFLIYLLSRYITLFWFPVFAAGLIWGGFRNYKKQKNAWAQQAGAPLPKLTPVAEFREAVSDVVQASREMVAEQRMEDAVAAQQAEVETQGIEGQLPEEPPTPPQPPRV